MRCRPNAALGGGAPVAHPSVPFHGGRVNRVRMWQQAHCGLISGNIAPTPSANCPLRNLGSRLLPPGGLTSRPVILTFERGPLTRSGFRGAEVQSTVYERLLNARLQWYIDATPPPLGRGRDGRGQQTCRHQATRALEPAVLSEKGSSKKNSGVLTRHFQGAG